MWEKQMEEGQVHIRNRNYDEAIHCFNAMLETYEGQEKPYYWAMKHLADLTGFIFMKDYFSAIDIYQNIISNYEGEDGLYEWCQIDMAKTYLLSAMDTMATYEDMASFLEPSDEKMAEEIAKVSEMREDFLMERAERIFKSRL